MQSLGVDSTLQGRGINEGVLPTRRGVFCFGGQIGEKASVCLESHSAVPSAAPPLGLTSGFALETSWANEMCWQQVEVFLPLSSVCVLVACGLQPAPDPRNLTGDGE